MSFWKKYGWKVLLSAVLAYLAVYLVFIIDGVLPTGLNLEKSNWLGFWAGFLSFSGSLFLGAVALWQNDKANELSARLLDLSEKASIPVVRIGILEMPQNKPVFTQSSDPRFVNFTNENNKNTYSIRFLMQNISELDIANITLNSLKINGNEIENFNSFNTSLNKSQSNNSYVLWQSDSDINIKTGTDCVNHFTTICFKLLMRTYLGEEYIQNITLEVYLNPDESKNQNGKRFYIHLLKCYNSSKPTKSTKPTTEDSVNE